MLRDGTLEAKAAAIRHRMGERGGVLVAFSGGVDSGLVAKLAHDALGDAALAVTAAAESLPARELEAALRFAREIGIRHRVVRYSELANPAYAANPTNRCYFCRKDLAGALWPVARAEGLGTVADGVLLSDLGDWRPGIQAMNEEGFWHPLVEVRVDKAEARALARALDLSFHAKPSMACLSSRIPYGQVVTVTKLRQIERAEALLHDLGFQRVRVRHHGDVARIEVGPDEVDRFLDPVLRRRVTATLRDLGFRYVAVDLEGYRTGALDEGLGDG